MLRFLVYLAIAIALTWCGATVPLGERTFFGHVKAVWSTDEAQDMKKGVEQGTRPVVEKVKRGVEAGYREAVRDVAPTADSARQRLDDEAERIRAKAEIDGADIEVAPVDAGVKSRKNRRAPADAGGR